MPKVSSSNMSFPEWSEVENYGVNTLNAGDEVELHFHDSNEYWIIITGSGTAVSEGVSYELGPGDMLLTKAGDEHSLVVREKMVAVYFYGKMPQGGRYGHLHRGVDPSFADYESRK